ncbi:hypothetical protein Tco_1514622 [Tanacetum coccineum]
MVPQTACRTLAVRPRDQDDHQDDDHPEGENSAKRQKTSKYKAYVSGESLYQVKDNEDPVLEYKFQDQRLTRQLQLWKCFERNSGPREDIIVTSQVSTIIFNDDDIEERTSRLLKSVCKETILMLRYVLNHWKNPHAQSSNKGNIKSLPGKPKKKDLFKLKNHSSHQDILGIGS